MRDCKGYLRRVVVVVFVCSSVGLGSLAFAGSGSSRRPNVVIIITDDQSWDSLGYMGGDVHTPRIDRMAREGLIFSD
ncbi:MAG: sulfatase-like hydrolase/transferase, partial [Planctomycetes bacterium]|nr:sulfatase-like hydrolase/transferase [Planctomycetota bacterium]